MDIEELKPCSYCGNEAEVFEKTNSQASAIYCSQCPLGVEDNDMSIKALTIVWNNLPRDNYENKTL